MKLSNFQPDKLKSVLENDTDTTLQLSSNMIYTNETNFHHNLQSTDRQVLSLHKDFEKIDWQI